MRKKEDALGPRRIAGYCSYCGARLARPRGTVCKACADLRRLEARAAEVQRI